MSRLFLWELVVILAPLFIACLGHILGESPAHSSPASPFHMPKILRCKEEFTPYLERKGYKTFSPSTSTCLAGHEEVVKQVQNYDSVVQRIVSAATTGQFRGKTFRDVAEYVDTFGSRITGSKALEDSIDWVENFLRRSGATGITSQPVDVPNWRRGLETATMILPRNKALAIKGLGQSVSTSLLGILAEAVVFNSYNDLLANLSRVKGKIVVLAYGGPVGSPLSTVNNGYHELAMAGARAALYKSAATFSLYSPHARRANLYYDGVAPKIPIAYLTLEDCSLLSRIAARGETIKIYLNMQNLDSNSTSRNVFGDLQGREKPEEFVLFAAHTDSWDVGQGLHDDAIGVILALEGLQLLKSLGLVPRRTLRLAFWTGEEYGFWGSAKYIKEHRSEFGGLSAVLEADYSCLAATGLVFNGVPEFGCILQEVINLVGSGSSGLLVQSPAMQSDVDNFNAIDIPVVSLLGDDGRYFWFHHTEADAITEGSVNTTEFDRCLGLWTSTAYIIADLQSRIKRFGE